jgi:nucleoside-diphosphate-sugar epimerase
MKGDMSSDAVESPVRFEGRSPRAVRVVTGATGFLGSHFVLASIRSGTPVCALARASSDAPASSRIIAAIAESSSAGPEVVQRELDSTGFQAVGADVLQPSCGADESDVQRLRASGPREFWHFAASLQYERAKEDAIWQTNVVGTRNALDLARRLGCESFHYVSTAYTAGRMGGAVPEELHSPDVAFNNHYERTKAIAEREVAGYARAHGMRHCILRPSIVIGPFATKGAGGSRTGLYGLVRELGRLRQPLRRMGRQARFRGEPSSTCNLIPVDWFIEDVLDLARNGVADGGVYHNTCERPLTVRELGDCIAEELDLPGFEIEPAPSWEPNALELLLEKRMEFYGAYLRDGKSFARARPLGRHLTKADLGAYIRQHTREGARR